MSRILRRPMFRGGRVDGRGTGITSGLGYAKGGQVQPLLVGQHPDEFKDAEGREQHWNPLVVLYGLGSLGMRYGIKPAIKYAPRAWQKGKNLYQSGKNLFKPQKTWEIGKGWTTTPGKGQKIWQSKWNPFQDPVIRGGTKVVGSPVKYGWKGTKAAPWTAAGVGGAGYAYKDELKDLWDEYWPWADEKADGREFVGEEAEIVGDPRDLPTEQEKIDEIIARIKAEEEAKREELIAALTPKKLSEDEKLDEIEKKKKMFEKVYGSGKSEDVSNMLLSFAGKALKPGADTKTAFGEFFEDEAKRPSSSKKYKDAAAQAAIQSFLTGETSYQKFQDDLLSYSNKLGIQTAAAKAAEKDKSLSKIKGESRETSTTKKNLNSAQTWLDNQGIDKYVNETNSKKVPVEELFVEENIGEFFVDQQTGEFFEIIRLEDGEIGKARRG